MSFSHNMGSKPDPEYEKARNGFIRELEQFHESRGLKCKGTPQINGREVDLYLLYQIVTSHGGWEKINVRNEWDDLLEHFNLPRAVNGGLSLKIIYLKYLEVYEKIHYLGEDVDGGGAVGGGGGGGGGAGGGRHDEEDDYDDFRHRRRYTTTPSNKPPYSTPTGSNSITPGPVHVNTVPLTDMNRAQFGMSTRLLEGADYDRLILSLQSPLPNDQDLAISICTLLSHETKHVLKFPKAPRILDLLLAHAGVYNHCRLRELMQETYQEGRGLNHNEFWMDTVSDKESRQLLCECFVHKVNHSIGIDDECLEYFDPERDDDPDLSEEERWIIANRKRISYWESEESTTNNNNNSGGGGSILLDCCPQCPCRGVKSDNPSNPFPAIHLQQETLYLVRKSASTDDKIGRRITQIANILRNLSFEDENALIMANNPTLLRFVLLAAECSWGTIPQLSLDLLGNLAQHVQLKEPSIDPISCRLLSLVTNGLFSTDRFRILRSLESLRELCRKEGNEEIFKQYIRTTVFKRLCELLTISDIMLLIYTLECLLSMTGLGEAICNELARVHGSVATLVSLVTVEAQSYGPKGCILMRVVETVTGTPQSNPTVTQQQGGASVHHQQQQQLHVGSGNASISQTVSGAHAAVTTISGNTVSAPVVSIPRQTSHSPVPSFMLGNLPNKQPSVSLPSSTAPIFSNNYYNNPVPSSSTNATQSALNVQLQQQHKLQHHQHQSSVAASNTNMNANINGNSHTQVPSPALSPSLSLSPAPSPGPPQGPVAHFVQSQSPSPSPQPGQQQQRQSSIGESPALANNNNNNLPAMMYKPTSAAASAANINVYTNLNTQSRNGGVGGILPSTTSGVTNMSTVTTSNSSCTFITTTMAAAALPVHSNNNTITSAAAATRSTGTSVNQQLMLTTTTTTSSASESANAVSNQSLNQQVYIPSLSLSLVTSRGTLSEEGWAIAWLKGAFEVASGTSIEQGESYRMYCAARKNPQAVLSMEQFIQCVKCAYGAAVGPVIKHFGGSSLSFIEGIRPKISIKPSSASPISINSTSGSLANTNTSVAVAACYPSVTPVTATSVIPSPALATTASATRSPGLVSSGATVNQLPVSVHIPSRENKSLSPILKATLSRPPKAKNPTGVAQRQQKKLQLELLPKKSAKDVTKEKKSGKVNGIDGNLETEESSASSSMNSSEESDVAGHGNNRTTHPHPPPLSFQGILRNGLGSDESKDTVNDELLEGKNKLKGMLIDLLERKVNPRETMMNGLMSNREIRISDKGLELVDKLEENSNSSIGPAAVTTTATTTTTSSSSVFNANKSSSSSFTNSVLDPSADSQSQSQMTFYSTTEQQVTFSGQVANQPQLQMISTNSNSLPGDSSSLLLSSSSTSKNVNETVLMSGGGSVGNGTGKHSNYVGGGGNNKGDGHVSSGSVLLGSALQLHADSSSSLSPPAARTPRTTAATTTVAANASLGMDGTDLLEKFNQISDLIVFPPEQLGIKRSHYLAHGGEDSSSAGESEPPNKKPNTAVNGNGGCLPTTTLSTSSAALIVSSSSSTFVNRLCPTSTPSVLQAALSSVTSVSSTTTTPSLLSTTTSASLPSSSMLSSTTTSSPTVCSTARLSYENKQLESSITAPQQQQQQQQLSSTSTSINSSSNYTNSVSSPIGLTNASAPNQMMQLRLSVNPQNQLTFSRQLVLPSGQQLFLSTTKSQSPLQGQVIISKPHNSSNDQMAKAIIILQQPQQQQSHQGSVQHPQQNSHNQAPVVQATTTPLQQQLQQNIPPTVANVGLHKQTRSVDYMDPSPTAELVAVESPYLCEWTGCGQRFNSPTQVFLHSSKIHTPETLTEAVRCEWGPNGCDPLLRKRLSLMTHLQDRHCSKHALELSSYRRRNKLEAPPPPQHPVHHPGYAPNAAFHAIKRHAMQFMMMNSKELMDDNEGPVTKSIRLTSALILKNMANYSTMGRRMLKGYESQLASIAMSNVESSRTIAQLLYDMQEINS